MVDSSGFTVHAAHVQWKETGTELTFGTNPTKLRLHLLSSSLCEVFTAFVK
jgi:hypothetical protein